MVVVWFVVFTTLVERTQKPHHIRGCQIRGRELHVHGTCLAFHPHTGY